MRLPRGIAFKLATLFLIIGLVPMMSVSVIAYLMARFPLTERPIESFVSRVARDTAFRIEQILAKAEEDTVHQATANELTVLVSEYWDNIQDSREIAEEKITMVQETLNHAVELRQGLDMILVAAPDGTVLVTSNVRRSPTRRPGDDRVYLWESGPQSNPRSGEDLADRPWWGRTASGDTTFIDWCNEDIILKSYRYTLYADRATSEPPPKRLKNPNAFTFGFAHGVPDAGEIAAFDGEDPPTTSAPRAILVAFYNWSMIQNILDGINEQFEADADYRSGYTFMFKDDLDTIIAHKFKENYRNSLVDYHDIPELHEAMKVARDAGPDEAALCHYTYREPKIAAAAPVRTSGWRLGFGIDKVDIYGDAERLKNWLILISLLISGSIVILIAYVSRRVTEPITRLIRQTNEIARGNLNARVEIHTNDEIAVLGDSFNKMASDLTESNKRLIKAEKTAAWREMARQVAHEIKNPLTPMKLSAQLVHRAYSDKHPDFEKILKDSVENMIQQIESLRKIASDFSNYAAFPKTELKPCSVRKLLESCVQMYQVQESSDVTVQSDCYFDESVHVLADEDALRRVFLNLFNNAFEAMDGGGTITVTGVALENEQGHVVDIRVKDTGRGIGADILDRLFEPYFTTRSSGTGLGLAIAKKTVEGIEGTIRIESTEGEGTTVIVTLPVHEE